MMGHTKNYVYFSIFQLLILGVISQDRILIDVESDISQDGSWDIDCDKGYADLSTDFDCGPGNGGTVVIPPEQLNGEKGFWTACEMYGCELKYNAKPSDTKFKVRVYQSDVETQVSFDGIVWDYVPGKGWVEFEDTLNSAGKTKVSLRFFHFSPDMFNILDKIVINGDFDPPTNPTTESTTEASTETTDSSSSTETTTDAITETTDSSSSTETTTTEEVISSSTDYTTTSNDISSTTDLNTTPVSTTEDEWDSSSTVSDDPIGSSSESSTSDEPERTSSTEVSTTSTDDPTSSSTNDPNISTTTDNDPSTTSDISSLPTSESTSDSTETETTPPVTPPPSPCTNPPCGTSSTRPSTTKKPSNAAGFMGGLWGKVLFSAIGASLFILLSACCLRFVCVRGGVLRRRKRNEDDLDDIISQNNSSNVNISSKVSPNMNNSEGELYLYMNRYPYLLNPSVQKANQAPNKIQISSLPPPSTSPSFSSSNTLWSPRAIYRESTPYMAFDEQNSGKSIGTIPSSIHVINDDYEEAMNDDYIKTARSNQTTQVSPPSHLPRKEASPVIPQRHYPETQNHNRSKWVVL